MNDFLTNPEKYREHIRRYTASIIHVLIHGFRGTSTEDFWGHVRNSHQVKVSADSFKQAVYEIMERVSSRS